MSTKFHVPASAAESELTEKRSRFLGHLCPVDSEDAAKDFITDIKKQYHDARHNCWCYRIADGPERFSDDGEPQGSAGMPMLEVFRREGVYNFVCVVTRYFGGVLLGTGGLSRAYSGAAKQALLDAGITSLALRNELVFSCPYALAERIKNLVSAGGASIAELRYGEEVMFRVLVTDDETAALLRQISELSGGKVQPRLSGSVLVNHSA